MSQIQTRVKIEKGGVKRKMSVNFRTLDTSGERMKGLRGENVRNMFQYLLFFHI